MTTEQMDWLDDERAGKHAPPTVGPKGGAGNSGATCTPSRRNLHDRESQKREARAKREAHFTTTDVTTHDEDTLFKVQAAITALGYSGQPVLDIINSLQNAGILFRERLAESDTTSRLRDLAHSCDDVLRAVLRTLGFEPDTDPVLAAQKRMAQLAEAQASQYVTFLDPDQPAPDLDPEQHFGHEADFDTDAEGGGYFGAEQPELTQAEEPIEHRLSRAFTNGWREGFERAQWGTGWDYSR